ncbi:unnamed protein product [marine sediment metagenome]|uniref:Uncharacterized protein n=1 Tax=marine sediment metagenome TaxID=412755 RepID=X1F708_9ZZZZ
MKQFYTSDQASEFMQSQDFKKLSKLKRFVFAVKNISPERLIYNKLCGNIGTCVGMTAAIVYLIFLKVYWMLFFLPFILLVQVMSTIETSQQLQRIKQMKEELEKLERMGKGGND